MVAWVKKLGVVAWCVALVLAGCQSRPVSFSSAEVTVSKDVVLHPIAPGVWIHTTYFDLPDLGRVGANGLVIIDGSEAMLIDTPWTNGLTASLCEWIAATHGAVVKAVIPTHFHEDCMGGLEEVHRRGAISYGLDQTVAIARQKKLPVPQVSYRDQILVRCGGTVARATYFGAGHTTDNVVVWLPQRKIFFAGCLVKSLDSKSLGNTKDGDLTAYPATLRKMQAAYPDAKIVVPGHGAWGGPELIEHTLNLCQAAGRRPGGP